MVEFAVLMAICAILANLYAWFLIQRFPAWSRRKTAVVAALPLPIIVWSLCVIVFANAATSSRESCGVDTCAMAMVFSMIVFLYGLFGYVFGIGGAVIAMSIAHKVQTKAHVAEPLE